MSRPKAKSPHAVNSKFLVKTETHSMAKTEETLRVQESPTALQLDVAACLWHPLEGRPASLILGFQRERHLPAGGSPEDRRDAPLVPLDLVPPEPPRVPAGPRMACGVTVPSYTGPDTQRCFFPKALMCDSGHRPSCPALQPPPTNTALLLRTKGSNVQAQGPGRRHDLSPCQGPQTRVTATGTWTPEPSTWRGGGGHATWRGGRACHSTSAASLKGLSPHFQKHPVSSNP